ATGILRPAIPQSMSQIAMATMLTIAIKGEKISSGNDRSSRERNAILVGKRRPHPQLSSESHPAGLPHHAQLPPQFVSLTLDALRPLRTLANGAFRAIQQVDAFSEFRDLLGQLRAQTALRLDGP